MSLRSRISSWFRATLGRTRMESEMDAELRFHLEAYAADLMRHGVARAEALRRARLEFGALEHAKEECREARGVRFGETLVQDLRYAARMLAKNRAMTVGVVLAIALGIGVNTGIFSLLNAAALQPLQVHDARRVVSIYQTFRGLTKRNVNGEVSMFSYPEYQDYREHNQVFSGLLAYKREFNASLSGEQPRQLLGQLISCNYFDVLNIRPALGRGLTEQECAAPGSAPVVVLSDATWRNAFNADAAIVGKAITINRVPLTVVGVAPPGFHGTELIVPEFWAPLTMQPLLDTRDGSSLGNENLSWLVLMGRLRDGVSVSQARADLSVIAGRIDARYSGRSTALSVDVASLFNQPEERGVIFGAGAIILAAVSLVLLIVCANVANLLLARASGRKKEIALRLSLGASRARLIRQLLTESVLLALIGGVLGTVTAFWAFNALFRLVLAHVPPGTPTIAFSIHPDLRILVYALALTVITGIIFGLAPALQASKPDLNLTLKDVGAGLHAKGTRSLLRSGLVVVQVSVCLVLLLTAGLLGRGLQEAQTIDPGFATQGVSVVDLDLVQQKYDAGRAAAFKTDLANRLGALPGVDTVAQATVVPLSLETYGSDIRIEGGESLAIHYDNITEKYFAALGIPIVRGRNFTESEIRAVAKVAVITEGTARKLWPKQDAVGQTFKYHNGEDTSDLMQVVGVVKDTRTSSLGKNDEYFFYFPVPADEQLKTKLLVQSSQAGLGMAKAVRDTVRAMDANVIVQMHPLNDNLQNFRLPSRIVTLLFTALGLLALVLAALGIYGVVAYIVSQRTREIGIRMALGADLPQVLRLVLRGSMGPALLGILLGVLCCAAVSRLFASLLFGVSPFDPLAFVLVPAFLLAVALLASYLPARRAMRVDPVVALRYE